MNFTLTTFLDCASCTEDKTYRGALSLYYTARTLKDIPNSAVRLEKQKGRKDPRLFNELLQQISKQGIVLKVQKSDDMSSLGSCLTGDSNFDQTATIFLNEPTEPDQNSVANRHPVSYFGDGSFLSGWRI